MLPAVEVWTRAETMKRVARFAESLFVVGGNAPQNEFTPQSMLRVDEFRRTH